MTHLPLFDIFSDRRTRELVNVVKARVLQRVLRLVLMWLPLEVTVVIDHTDMYVIVAYSPVNDTQSPNPPPKNHLSVHLIKLETLFTPPDFGILITVRTFSNSRRISTWSFSCPMTIMTLAIYASF